MPPAPRLEKDLGRGLILHGLKHNTRFGIHLLAIPPERVRKSCQRISIKFLIIHHSPIPGLPVSSKDYYVWTAVQKDTDISTYNTKTELMAEIFPGAQ